MRRLGLLLAVAGLWLFLASIPALADGGPHVANTNNGSLTLTADSCAGCHRAHTAQGPYLIKASSTTLLCLSCHGASTVGATVDVTTGVQYRSGSTYTRDGTGDPNADPSTWVNGTKLGATRAGGFLQARLGDPARIVLGTSLRAKVSVSLDGAHDVTSAHLQLENSPITAQHVAWGNGVNGSGAGPEVDLECTSCHNPHGNGQYRILNPLPSLTSTSGAFSDPTPINVSFINGTTGQEYIQTATGHEFMVGDLVTVAGVTGVSNGDYVVVGVPNGIRIQINTVASWPTATPLDLPGTGPQARTGTVKRTEAPVADAPLGTPDGNGVYPERNYTVIQTKGTQGTDSSYLLYASQVISGGFAATDGDYFRRTVPWNKSSGTDLDAPNGQPATVNDVAKTITNVTSNVITVTGHGYAVGDVIRILGLGADGDYTVATKTTDTFTVTGGSFTDNASPSGATAQRVSGGQGEIAFNVQMTAWCASCHTRYFGYQSPNPTGTAPGTSTQAVKTITDITGNVITIAGHGYAVGDLLHITGVTTSGNASADGDYRVADVLSADTFWVTGSNFNNDTSATAQRIAPATASDYFFPNVGEDIFKYTHSTRDNRVCTTCHVAHGSNVIMDGDYSSTVAYPDGTVSASSRLLKVGNRGLCTLCHDPSETAPDGTYTGPTSGSWTILTANASTDVFTTSATHGLVVGELVGITGNTTTNGIFYVKTVTSTTFTVSQTIGGGTFDILTNGTGGTVKASSLSPILP